MSNAAVQEMEHKSGQPGEAGGPKYFVVIEGTEHPWPKESISFEEIAQLGGWSPTDGVIEVDENNNERTLKLGETVQLKPGHGFSKKVRWKRG